MIEVKSEDHGFRGLAEEGLWTVEEIQTRVKQKPSTV